MMQTADGPSRSTATLIDTLSLKSGQAKALDKALVRFGRRARCSLLMMDPPRSVLGTSSFCTSWTVGRH